MTDNPSTIITIILAVTTLLGFVVQKGGNYLMKKNDEKDKQIQKLTEDFKNVINDQRHLDRELQEKGHKILDGLSSHIKNSDETNKVLISFLKNGRK